MIVQAVNIESILEIVKYLMPAVLVLAGVSIILNQVQKRNDRLEMYQIRQEALSKVIPLRLNAYERGVLFLERIRPENLLLRSNGTGKSAKAFQAQLNVEIRSEYEHNISQQVYISNEAWLELVKAKEQILALINQSAKEMEVNSTGIDLGKVILAKYSQAEEDPVLRAILSLKADLSRVFRA